MSAPLFVYGALRDPDLLAAVLDRPLRPCETMPAAAPGFRASFYPGRVYPALIRAPGGSAEGLLLIALSPFECDLLDAFESPEFVRSIIPVMLAEELHEAHAYLPAGPIPADDPWQLDHWQQTHKPAALAAASTRATEIRRKLIAIRPN